MRLLITDLTDMSAGNFCVAGWDIDNHVMVRPLPDGSNWSTALIIKYGVEPGILMEFVPSGRPHNGSYPHSTEDTVVNSGYINVLDRTATNWLAQTPTRAATLQEAFDGHVKAGGSYRGRLQSLYVTTDTKCRSLWGLEISRHNIEFLSDSFQGGPERLKAVIFDGEENYTLSVSSHALKEAFGKGGLPAANALIPNDGRLHVRLGLARAFKDTPERCTLMVNGVYG